MNQVTSYYSTQRARSLGTTVGHAIDVDTIEVLCYRNDTEEVYTLDTTVYESQYPVYNKNNFKMKCFTKTMTIDIFPYTIHEYDSTPLVTF